MYHFGNNIITKFQDVQILQVNSLTIFTEAFFSGQGIPVFYGKNVRAKFWGLIVKTVKIEGPRTRVG